MCSWQNLLQTLDLRRVWVWSSLSTLGLFPLNGSVANFLKTCRDSILMTKCVVSVHIQSECMWAAECTSGHMATVKTLAVITGMGAWFGGDKGIWIVEQLQWAGNEYWNALPDSWLPQSGISWQSGVFEGAILKENQGEKVSKRVGTRWNSRLKKRKWTDTPTQRRPPPFWDSSGLWPIFYVPGASH